MVFAIAIISFRVLIFVSRLVVLGGVVTFPGIVEGHVPLLERFWKTPEITWNVLGICSSLSSCVVGARLNLALRV